MQIADLGPIPKLVRWFILLLLSIAVVASVGLLAQFTLIQPDRELAIVSLGAAQAALTGLVVVSVVLFSFRMKQTRDIQRIIDSFFIDELMPALKGVDLQPAPFLDFDSPRQFRKSVPKITTLSSVSTDFCPGRDAASFRIRKGDGRVFEFYLKVNVRHVVIKYFFDPTLFSAENKEAEFHSLFEQTLNGAKSVGYTFELVRRYHASRQAEVLELSLYFSVGPDMLANPAERLFLSNDIRTLTASMVHTLQGVFERSALSDRKAGATPTA